ncbi:MAG: general secretion pathway protein GspN [Polaromonas sp. 28-63-22]|nr:MAG: general secretion pathway protein GspN [Polaromonas sp. 28-63-22]
MLRTASRSRNPAVAAPWGWALAGVVLGVVLAVVLFAPARWLSAIVSQASSGQVQLIEPHGTVWNGSARLLLSGGRGSRDSATLPGQIDWRLRPGWLALNFQLTAACCTPSPLQARLAPGWSGSTLQLADGTSQWPAALLAGLGTPWNTVQAEGSLRLVTQGLSFTWNQGRLAVAGGAELSALAMSSRLSTLKPMGSYRITLQGGDTPALNVSTLEGSLQLSGSGRWVGSRLRFEGVASATPEHQAALANLLNIIGRRDGTRSIITLG